MKKSDHIPLIVGLGHDFLGDDAVGLHTVTLLQKKYPDMANYHVLKEDLGTIIELWKDRDVVLINAVLTDHPNPGKIHLLDDLQAIIDHRGFFTTHGMGLSDALLLSKALDRIPRSLLLIGVEGECWEFGQPITDRVKDAIPFIEWKILEYLNRPTVQKFQSFNNPPKDYQKS